MPKTAVNEDRCFPPPKHDVGTSGQILGMKPISKAHTVKHAANRELGLSVPCADTSHSFASLRWGEDITQGLNQGRAVPHCCVCLETSQLDVSATRLLGYLLLGHIDHRSGAYLGFNGRNSSLRIILGRVAFARRHDLVIP
jgi:hypothetical protein